MKHIALALLLVLALGSSALAESLNADQILKKADDVINASKNLATHIRMNVVDADGTQKVREIKAWQQDGMRMVKFLKPASDRGIALLSTDSETNYVYLPAYKKVRRVASHVRNQTFMGTDFSQEDMAVTRYADDFTPELVGEDDTHYQLKLTRKPGSKFSYSRLDFTIAKDHFVIKTLVYYNNAGRKLKTEERIDVRQFKGKYWVFMRIVMTAAKDGHQTRMDMLSYEYDIDLSKDFFTQRTLKRPVR